MEETKKSPNEATEEQIQKWKQEHGDVFAIKVEDKICYLKRPDRKTFSFASQVQNDPLRFNEVILKNCWLAGDEQILTDDSLFLAACTLIDQVTEFKKAELLKF
jgi:hypothetical protein